MPRLTSKEDARDVFNYMKNERIGQTFRLYYAVRADFEASTGNDEKVPSILQRGKACPPVSASAAASEAAFLEFMVSPSTCCECHPTTSQQQQQRDELERARRENADLPLQLRQGDLAVFRIKMGGAEEAWKNK